MKTPIRNAQRLRRTLRAADRRLYDAILRKYVRDCCAAGTVTRADELADLVGRSRPSFSRIILALFGQSPTDILRDLRLEEAKRLLRVTDLNVDEIAAASAFGHRSVFYRLFTEVYGMTAAEYRETART